MNDELFTEPNDKIQEMVDKAVQKAMNKQDVPATNFDPVIDLANNMVDAFKKGGYNRKESVYLTGQVMNGLASSMGGLLS